MSPAGLLGPRPRSVFDSDEEYADHLKWHREYVRQAMVRHGIPLDPDEREVWRKVQRAKMLQAGIGFVLLAASLFLYWYWLFAS